MSIKTITLVWDNFPGSGSELLTMLALADWCNDTGGSLHPSIATVAKKIRLSEKQARRIMHELINQGWLSVVGNEFGGNPGDSRRYQMNLSKLTTPSDVTPPMGVTPPIHVHDPSHGCPSTPPMGGSQTVIEPSRTVSEKKPKRENAKKLPETWEPNEAHQKIADDNRLSIATERRKFTDYHQAKGSKFVDWNAAFRNWLHNAAEYQKEKQPQQRQVDYI